MTATVAVPASGNATAQTANCPSGTTVISSGGSDSDAAGGYIDQTYPSGKTGWTTSFGDTNGNASTGTVYAICAPAAATAP